VGGKEKQMILQIATQIATGVVPERYLRTLTTLAQRQAWDASKEVYVTVETPSKHIAGMCSWLQDRAAAVARDARVNRFNPSFVTAKLGAREAAKEDGGLFAWGATGFAPEGKPVFADNAELLAALYELRDQQQAIEAAQIAALAEVIRVEQPAAADPWAEARAAKRAAKAAKRAAA